MRRGVWWLGFVCLWSWAVSSGASRGDRLKMYRFCVENCLETGCVKLLTFRGQKETAYVNCHPIPCCNNTETPLILTLTAWNCQANCEYLCMRAQEAYRLEKGRPRLKYKGKWAFIRVFGCQEFFSVVFSLGNLLIHATHLRQLKSPRFKSQSLYGRLWRLYAYLSMNSWLCSAIFHARDTEITQALDYVSADSVIVFGLFIAVLRITQTTSLRGIWMVAMLCLLPLLRHVSYLLFIKFDHRYNFNICLLLGVLQSLMWLVWGHRVCHPGRWYIYGAFAFLCVALIFEVYDFPPLWNLLDGHALWHACTIPILRLWYLFIYSDLSFKPPLKAI